MNSQTKEVAKVLLATLLEGYRKREGLEGTFTNMNRFGPARNSLVQTLPLCPNKQRIIRLSSLLGVMPGEIEEVHCFCGAFQLTESQEFSVCGVLAEAVLLLLDKMPSLPEEQREYYLKRFMKEYVTSRHVIASTAHDPRRALSWAKKIAEEILLANPSLCRERATKIQVGRPKKSKSSAKPSAA